MKSHGLCSWEGPMRPLTNCPGAASHRTTGPWRPDFGTKKTFPTLMLSLLVLRPLKVIMQRDCVEPGKPYCSVRAQIAPRPAFNQIVGQIHLSSNLRRQVELAEGPPWSRNGDSPRCQCHGLARARDFSSSDAWVQSHVCHRVIADERPSTDTYTARHRCMHSSALEQTDYVEVLEPCRSELLP